MKIQIKSLVTAIFMVTLSLAAYESAVADISDPVTVRAFEKKSNSIGKEIQNDSSYKRIPLDTKKDQDWFTLQALMLFDKKISKDQFVKEGDSRFPGYKKSWEYISDKYLN